MKKSTTKLSTAAKVEIGAGLLAAAAAGYYFYASKDAEKHRKIAQKWATDLTAVDKAKLARVVLDLKKNWSRIQEDAARKEKAAKVAVKVIKKAVKKVRAA